MMMKNLFLFSIMLISVLMITSCEKEDPDAPQACFVTPSQIVAGFPVSFNSSCTVNATAFSWDFGDGNTSNEANPSHTYTSGGNYTVSLTVDDAEGNTDQQSENITVTAPSLIEHSGTINEDETWLVGLHLITSDVWIEGAILTIEPGAVILFNSGTGMHFGYHSGYSGATLIANGTADKPITFTSASTTNKSPGDWDYIGFYFNASSASSLQYCIIEYGGGYNDGYGEIYIEASSLNIDNATIRYSESVGIGLNKAGFFESFTSNTIVDNGSYPISIYGNFVHTIGANNTITTDKGVLVKGDNIEESDAIWLKLSTPYILDGDLYIESATGAKLTLNPGVELLLSESTSIILGYHSNTFGVLIAEGTASEHITISSAAPEISRGAGDWNYIAFYDGAGNNSSLAYCDISYGGGYSSNYGMIVIDGSSISVSHSTFMHSEFKGIALENDGSFISFTNNTFEDNGSVPIEIHGNYAHTIGSGNIFNTGPGILVKGDDMKQTDVTWLKQNVPYIIDGILYIESTTGSKLTIDPGTTIQFSEGSYIILGYHANTFGSLVAQGTAEKKITFTTGAPSGFESPGDWYGIWFYEGTGANTILDFCTISYGGGYSGSSGNLSVKNMTVGVPSISNCEITNSAAYGIYLGNTANPSLTGNTFSNNASGNTN